jgi:glutamate 5-kinase
MAMSDSKLTIIKIGTNALVDADGRIRGGVIAEIMQTAKRAQTNGEHVLVVTSGAVRVGRIVLGDKTVPKKIAAGVGHPVVFEEYKKIAATENISVAELLLTRSYLIRRDLFAPLKETLNDFFTRGIVPIVNENDVLVHGTDLAFDGNDSLAQALAVSLEAKKIIIISDVAGLYDSDPSEPGAKLIPEVDNITDQFIAYCSKTVSGNSTGGMLSKLKSIRICTAVGIDAVIVTGLTEGNILKAYNGEAVGTLFHGRTRKNKVTSRERWLLAARNSTGSIVVDPGAVEAMTTGASLLAVGVKKVYGSFNEKEVIEIVDQKNRGVAFGIVDLSGAEIEEMLRTKDTHKKMLVHANNLFLLD